MCYTRFIQDMLTELHSVVFFVLSITSCTKLLIYCTSSRSRHSIIVHRLGQLSKGEQQTNWVLKVWFIKESQASGDQESRAKKDLKIEKKIC